MCCFRLLRVDCCLPFLSIDWLLVRLFSLFDVYSLVCIMCCLLFYVVLFVVVCCCLMIVCCCLLCDDCRMLFVVFF